MTRDEMTAIVDGVLEEVPAPDAAVVLEEERNAAVRFGQNRITQNMDTFRRSLVLTVGDGSRKAVFSTRRVDAGSIPETVAHAMDLLASSAPDPEYMPPVDGGQVYPLIEDYDEETAAAAPDGRMRGAHLAIGEAVSRGFEASGYSGVLVTSKAVGTSTGNLAWHRKTGCSYRLTLDDGTASSYRSLQASSWDGIPVEETVAAVAGEVEADRDQIELPPGSYRLILEPQAVADLMPFLVWSMGARVADEGVTVFSGMEGKSVTGGDFTLESDLYGPVKGIPFSDEGQPSTGVTWIENGILSRLQCDRFWARKTGREPLFGPGTFSLEGGEGTATDLASGVDRGVLIRRFWYIRFVDQKSLYLTGMTRDGVFLVENGRVTAPVRDFRWNWKPLELFARIERLGGCVPKGQFCVPAMVIGEQPSPFTGSDLTD
jgi:predicted Zn-dependent protease